MDQRSMFGVDPAFSRFNSQNLLRLERLLGSLWKIPITFANPATLSLRAYWAASPDDAGDVRFLFLSSRGNIVGTIDSWLALYQHRSVRKGLCKLGRKVAEVEFVFMRCGSVVVAYRPPSGKTFAELLREDTVSDEAELRAWDRAIAQIYDRQSHRDPTPIKTS